MTMTTNDDKGKAAEATICVKCKHIIPSTPEGEFVERCDVNAETDYVTGAFVYDSCWRKNDKGTCPDYEERGDDG